MKGRRFLLDPFSDTHYSSLVKKGEIRVEFMNGALDPIGTILICFLLGVGIVVWNSRSSKR